MLYPPQVPWKGKRVANVWERAPLNNGTMEANLGHESVERRAYLQNGGEPGNMYVDEEYKRHLVEDGVEEE